MHRIMAADANAPREAVIHHAGASWESVLQEYDSRTDRGIERTQASRPPSGGVGHMLLPAGNANRKSGLGAPREAQFQGFPEAPRLDLGALPALSCAHSRAGEPDCRS